METLYYSHKDHQATRITITDISITLNIIPGIDIKNIADKFLDEN